MKDSELNELLKAARLPQRSSDYWERFPRRIVTRLHWKPASPRASHRPSPMAWAIATAAACLVVGFLLSHRGGESKAVAEKGHLQNEKIIAEMLEMFPNRVRAIVQDEHGVNLVLSDNENVPASAPLWVKICDGKSCSSAVTFSGQEIQFGQRQITVLADPKGKIILAGDHFLWSNGKTLLAANPLKVEAKLLSSAVL